MGSTVCPSRPIRRLTGSNKSACRRRRTLMSASAAPPLKVAPEISGTAAGSKSLPPSSHHLLPPPPTSPNEQQDCITAKLRLGLPLPRSPPGMSPVCPSAPSLHPSSSSSSPSSLLLAARKQHICISLGSAPPPHPPAGPPHAERAAMVAHPSLSHPQQLTATNVFSSRWGWGASHQYARRRFGSPTTRRNDCQCTVGR